MTLLSLNGLLVVDKPAGLTSHDVVARIRKLGGLRRVGHTGTLDPMATGVLVLCLGKATRLIPFIEEAGGSEAKEYEASIRFGFETTTDDAEGEPRTAVVDPASLTRESIDSALSGFRGDLLQIPPAFSAKKIDGERAYARARRGEDVNLKPVPVHVAAAELMDFENPTARIRFACSRGTYIRALARDLGRAVGTGAHLAGLRRTRSGAAMIEAAVALATLTEATLLDSVMAMEHALPLWPLVLVDAREVAELRQGRAIRNGWQELSVGTRVRICQATGSLVALARVEDGRLRPFLCVLA